MKTQLVDLEEFQKAISDPVNIDSAIESVWNILCKFQNPTTTWAVRTDKFIHKGFMWLEKIQEKKTNLRISDSILLCRCFENGDIVFKYQITKIYPIQGCQGTNDVIETYFNIRDEHKQSMVTSYNSKIVFITRALGEIYTWGNEFSPSLMSLMSCGNDNAFSNIYNTYIPKPKK